MATFGKASFIAASYASFRPTYPRELYDFVFEFHRRSYDAKWEHALDLGCGTGQATLALTPFKRVTGVDPSAGMVRRARDAQVNQEPSTSQDRVQQTIDFVQSPAEGLGFLADESVDLVISAQACHWFDWSMVWPELGRILRKGGSAAHWIYSEMRLPSYPQLTPLIAQYAGGTDPYNSVGPYWQQPGRSILNQHLATVPEPNEVVPGGVFAKLERACFTGSYFPDVQPSRPIIMRKVMTWNGILCYLRTWSALHTFKELHPEDVHHPDGPLETRFWNTLRLGATARDGSPPAPEAEVEVDWGVALILARKQGSDAQVTT